MGIFGADDDSGGGGNFPDIIKVSVESRMISRQDYDGEKTSTEITPNFKCIMDLANLETGWATFTSAGPNFALARIGEPYPARPSIDHKKAFRVMLKLSKDCGGDIRELSSNSRFMRDSMKELHDLYEAGRDGDKLPVVTLKSWKEEKVDGKNKFPSKTFFRPIWQIVSWVDRPADLQYQPRGAAAGQGERPLADTQTQTTSRSDGPPSTGSTRVEAPKAKEPELADSDDFG